MQATVTSPLTFFFFFFQFKREQLGGGIFQVIAEMLRAGHVFLPCLLFFLTLFVYSVENFHYTF
jgi:hypothetical protein